MAETTLIARQKFYESKTTAERFLPGLPVVVRLDGKSFHTLTKNFVKPFDRDFRSLMAQTAMFLLQESGAVFAYTQSDEITLILYNSNLGSQIYFDGHRQKIETALASKAGSFFGIKGSKIWPMFEEKFPAFDARAFNVPSRTEAYNSVLWRVRDATRNSITALAQSKFSHKELLGKNSKQKQEMLWQQYQINWNSLHRHLKEGVFVGKRLFTEPLSEEIRQRVPEPARSSLPEMVERRRIVDIDMPPFASLSNPLAVIFDSADPVVDQSFDKDAYMTGIDEDETVS